MADKDRDSFLNLEEFTMALSLLKDSDKKAESSDDAEQLQLLQDFLDACVREPSLTREVFDEIRCTGEEKNDMVSLSQWKNAEFFEDA